MGAFDEMVNGFINDSRKGYEDTRSGKYNIIIAIVLIAIALYYIQEFTGIPVWDWTTSAIMWIVRKIDSLL
ncbi:MAG: hypothetical protein J6W24_06785 [Prevotella sp.]|nr:hypothetical protein [Prevotella sp.]